MEPLFVAVAAGHRLARCPEVTLGQLAGGTWCLAEGAHSALGIHLTRACSHVGHSPQLRTADLTSALQLAELSQAVLPMMPGTRPREGLVYLPLRDAPLRMATVLYWRPDGPLSTAEIHGIWHRLVRAQHEIVERTPVYRAWLSRHPDWHTTPPAPAAGYDPTAGAVPEAAANGRGHGAAHPPDSVS